MSEERFQALEEKLAFIEMANVEMGDEIFRQQKEIEVLTKGHQMLLQRIAVSYTHLTLPTIYSV